jgi:hypothetical protein
MRRPELVWHLAARDLHKKANWKVADIARAFGVNQAEAWWVVHNTLRREYEKDKYKADRADPERWAKRQASQRAYYLKRRQDPNWRSKMRANAAAHRAERRAKEFAK